MAFFTVLSIAPAKRSRSLPIEERASNKRPTLKIYVLRVGAQPRELTLECKMSHDRANEVAVEIPREKESIRIKEE